MKTNDIIMFILLAAAFWSCSPDRSNNQNLDYEELEVNFKASCNAVDFSTGDRIGIVALCTDGGGTENRTMSPDGVSSAVSLHLSATDGNQVMLKKSSDRDAVIARKGDHNFRFYAVCPYIDGGFDVNAIPMSVPSVQSFKDGLKSRMTLVAGKVSTNVVPVQELEFRSFFSVLNFMIARDIIEEGVPAVLKSVTLAPVNSAALEDPLAVSGVCDAEKMTFTQDPSTAGYEVTVDFGDGGYGLEDDFTTVSMLVNPFYVPEGGFELTVRDVNGKENTIEVLAAQEDFGKEIAGGEVVEVMVDRINDGIVPVEWPVVFPIGFPGGDTSKPGYLNKTVQTRWDSTADRRGEGYWSCPEQPQAWAQWHWGAESSSFSPLPFLELVNSAKANVSTSGVKGAWTGDALEFTIPVKKFKANSSVTFSIPICCKNSPVFWEVKYLDGDVWKSTAKENLPAYEGSDVTRNATWALPFGGTAGGSAMQSVTMNFENEVKSGELKIRMECVDGTVVTTGKDAVKTVSAPVKNSAGTACSGNFYFAEHGTGTVFKPETAVTFTLN